MIRQDEHADADRNPLDVIAEILDEHLVEDPRAVADIIIEHLRDWGYQITPIEAP